MNVYNHYQTYDATYSDFSRNEIIELINSSHDAQMLDRLKFQIKTLSKNRRISEANLNFSDPDPILLRFVKSCVPDNLGPGIYLRERDVIDEALWRGANIEAKGMHGIRPLMAAAQNSRRLIINYLLSMGADLKAEDDEGNNVFYYAAFSGGKDLLDELYNKFHCELDQPNLRGVTPFHFALLHNRTPITEWFMRQNPNIAAIDRHGRNVLTLLMQKRFITRIRRKIYAYLNNNNGFATDEEKQESIGELSFQLKSLEYEEKCDTRILKRLCEALKNLNLLTRYINMPIHLDHLPPFAPQLNFDMRYPSRRHVVNPIDYDANILRSTRISRNGMTPFLYALYIGDVEATRFFVDGGANFSLEDQAHQTAACYATLNPGFKLASETYRIAEFFPDDECKFIKSTIPRYKPCKI